MTKMRCNKCGADAGAQYPVLHHFICSYVGPEYDFAKQTVGKLCPKCNRLITDDGKDWEIIGDCQFCTQCGDESMVPLEYNANADR